MRRLLLALSLVTAALATAAGQGSRPKTENEAEYRLEVVRSWKPGSELTKHANDVLFPAWLAAVEQHTPGEADAAVLEISGWSGGDLDLLFKWVLFELTDKTYGLSSDARHVVHPATRVAALVRRGAVLHADIALLIQANPSLPGTSLRSSLKQYYIAQHSDGRAEGGFASDVHLEIARGLLSFLTYAGLADVAYESLWYRATTASLLQSWQYGYAEPQIRVGLEALPQDAHLLFYAGALHEAFAAPRTQRGLEHSDVPAGYTSMIGPARDELQRAEKLFVRALRADPADDEVRLHHGRVLGQLDRHAEAAAELALIDGKLQDHELAYYAALFRGQEEGELGHRAAERDAFERAAALFPNAQSPMIAYSRLARRNGDRAAAVGALRRLFTLPTDENDRLDPWWRYDISHVRDADALMKTLYDRFAAEETP